MFQSWLRGWGVRARTVGQRKALFASVAAPIAAAIVVAAVFVTPGCGGGRVTCSSVGHAGDNASWGDCSDGKERQIKCDPPTGQGDKIRHACTCIEGGVVGKKFEMADLTTLRRLIPPTPEKTIQASYEVVNKQCSWNLGPK